MVINGERLLKHLYDLREFTATPGEGVTRFSYSENDIKAREYIYKIAEEAGCSVEVDQLRNVRIGLKTNRPEKRTVVCGSHCDSVQNGGWLDGIYGVTSALEVMLTLAENDFEGKYNYEMVIFAEEEGSNFGSTMTGSKFLIGQYTEENLDKLTDDNGRTLRDYLGIEKLDENIKWNFEDIKTMLEIHIEQGPVLDREGISVGIVDSIFGMRVIEVTIEGVGNHAGATPMRERYDALCTAAECVLTAENMVMEDPDKRTVVTVGKMNLYPNQSNVIPEKVNFSLEVRDKDNDKINRFMDLIIEAVYGISEERGVKATVKEHSSALPIHLNDDVIARMTAIAETEDFNFKVMDSGAVHDAAMIAQYAPTGMIFVPSINGRSHVPEEDTKPEDLIRGTAFLLDVVVNELNE